MPMKPVIEPAIEPITEKLEKAASRRGFLGWLGAGALVLLVPPLPAGADESRVIEIYKTPYCGCCGQWSKILANEGFETKVYEIDDLTPVRELVGLPEELESCHTAVIDGYVVEGHVPVEAIEKMLSERPPIAGIAVPGMPSGSPGMPGPEPEPFDVISFTPGGRHELFMSFR
jgi:hypothetical protein